MAKSKGRGAVAALGFFLLFAGLVGGGVLYIVSERRPAQAVDGFARAPVGCTTTLEFSDTGDFYVYEEVGGADDVEGCQPIATPDADFTVEFSGDLTPDNVRRDDSISYDVDGYDGRSLQRIAVTEPGQYTVEVTGDDLTVLAALGRDPDEGVDDLRRNAITVAIIGIVLGLLMLVLSGRRSKRAAVAGIPDGPGWGPTQRPVGSRTVEPVNLDQKPVNPHEPTAPAKADLPTAPLPLRDDDGSAATWDPPEPDAPTAPDPMLPDSPGRPSGT